tara:strand:- start:2109 stop:2774 length:666 start_codon:yes stop_codon:yes gene_type:complete
LSTFLITGSNRGIGLELSNQLFKQGHKVIATCRESSTALERIGVQVIDGIDISSKQSFIKLENNIKGIKIDCLINNAGIAEYNSLENLDLESIKKQFNINALSPLYFSKSIIKYLNENSKIAFITSRMGSIGDNSSGGSYGYRMSKVALTMAAKSLSVDLLRKKIFVAIIHPGLVSTRMTGFTKNGISPEASVRGILERIHNLNSINTGTFWHSNGEILPF